MPRSRGACVLAAAWLLILAAHPAAFVGCASRPARSQQLLGSRPAGALRASGSTLPPPARPGNPLPALAAAAALLLLAAGGKGPIATEAEIASLLDSTFGGEQHVNVESLEFSEGSRIDQYAQGFSEGFSNGPLLQEWRSNLHPRFDALAAKHPVKRGQDEFWDLGSGTGENLLKAFLTDSSGAVVDWLGVERMPDRCRLADSALERLAVRARQNDRPARFLQRKLGLRAEEVQVREEQLQAIPGEKAKCLGSRKKQRICVVKGDILEIRDFSHAKVVFLNIDDPAQIVTEKVLSGALKQTAPPNSALLVSYPLEEAEASWKVDTSGFEVVQDWSGNSVDRAKWLHYLYWKAPS